MSKPGNIIVKRREYRQLKGYSGGRLLVYERRKQVKHGCKGRCIDWDVYATVTSTGECILESVEGDRIWPKGVYK